MPPLKEVLKKLHEKSKNAEASNEKDSRDEKDGIYFNLYILSTKISPEICPKVMLKFRFPPKQ